MGKADVVRFGGLIPVAALAAGLMGSPAAALDLPSVSLPPVSAPPLGVPVPATAQVGPVVVTPPAVEAGSDGLHVDVPLPGGDTSRPGTIGVGVGPDGPNISLPGGLNLPDAGSGIPGLPGVPSGLPGEPASGGPLPTRGGRATGPDASGAPGATSRPEFPTPVNASQDAQPQAQIVDGDPAGATGALADNHGGGVWSLLSSAAHSKVAWALLIALALVARLVAAWAWRDALRRPPTEAVPARSRDRSATV